jgi:hypothetical protein
MREEKRAKADQEKQRNGAGQKRRLPKGGPEGGAKGGAEELIIK